ncbi:MAG: beta-aspartyl-peptidase [Clostridiales bacterium]|nr:beta-aspartyl-peptidase [Clostridiales bacterium]
MFTLMKRAHIYAPEDLGIQDVLIGNDRVIRVASSIDFQWEGMEEISAEGKLIFPGFIDQHVHITGGGGESGFRSRVPEVRMTDCVKNGVTTVVGVLGTDSTSRSVENIVAKAKGLTEEGITAYCLTGAYNYPSPTLTGLVAKDVAFIPEVLGVKLAISDHRSSQVTREELTRLAMDVRKAALLAGKAGIVHMHTGKGKSGLKDVIEVVETSDVPIQHFRPTHCGNLHEDAITFGKMGGHIDYTTGANPQNCAKFVMDAIQKVDFELITMSSDSNGSMPIWNEKHEIIGMGVGRMSSLFEAVKILIGEYHLPMEKAVALITSNVAKGLGLYPHKGCLHENADADLVITDQELTVCTVFAKGQKMMEDGKILVDNYFGIM